MALQRLDGVWFTFHSDLSLDNGGLGFGALSAFVPSSLRGVGIGEESFVLEGASQAWKGFRDQAYGFVSGRPQGNQNCTETQRTSVLKAQT